MHGKNRLTQWALIAALIGATNATALGARVFLARPGEAGSVPTTGPFTINVNPGDTLTIEVYIAETGPQLLGGYQAGLPGTATLVGGSGTITYVNTATGSVLVDEARSDWVFAGVVGVTVFTSETGLPAGFAMIGLAPFGTGVTINDIRYAGEFEMTVSADASGTFRLNPLPNGAPPNGGTALTDETGVGQVLAELQDLIIKVGPPPANDNCVDAEVATEGNTPFNTGTATTSMPNNNFGGGGNAVCADNGDDTIENDVWFEYTATCGGPVTVSTCNNASFDTRLEVYTGCGTCPPTALLACNDNGAGCSGGTSLASFTATAGSCYTIRVGGNTTTSLGTGTLAITSGSCFIDGTCHLPGAINPANECERCDAATSTADWSPVAAATPCTDDGNECTQDACDGAGTCAHPGSASGTPCTDDGEVCTLDQCDGAGTCAHPPASAGIACPDDGNECTLDECDGLGACGHPAAAAGTPCDDGLACTGTGSPGIDPDACDGAGGCMGEFDPNCSDNCVDAAEALEGVNPGNNTGFGTSQQVSCAFNSTNDAWFVHTANCDGLLRISTTGSSFDTVLTVFDACGGPELACDDDGGPGLASSVDIAVTAGEDYFIRIAGFNGAQGPIVLNITRLDTCRIASVCHPAGTVNPANECEACQPFASTTGWSPRSRGTACGVATPDDPQCDSPDACDGAGSCEPNHKPAGIACGDPSDDECDNPDTCDGLGFCGDNFETAGAMCGDPNDDECDNPDSCDGAGACAANFESTGTACGSAFDDDCDDADTCDGAGVCLDNLEPLGTACGDGTDDECTDPDTCDGTGACLVNHAPDLTSCDFMGGGPGSGLCDTGVCISACETATDCGDQNDDTIVDDGCMWYECTASGCNSIPRIFGDVGGPFGVCPIDGFANVHDQNHVLTCFQLINPCDPINIDVGGPFGDCNPDGFCNVHDVNHVLNAFSNTTTCSCPSDGPAPELPVVETPVVGGGALIVVPRDHLIPGTKADIDVFVEGTFTLQSFQLEMGSRLHETLDALAIVAIRIDERKDFVFAGRELGFSAFNRTTGQMLAGLVNDAVAVSSRAYLATYTVEVPAHASGTVDIGVLDGGQTFLIAPNGRIAITATQPITSAVGTARRSARR